MAFLPHLRADSANVCAVSGGNANNKGRTSEYIMPYVGSSSDLDSDSTWVSTAVPPSLSASRTCASNVETCAKSNSSLKATEYIINSLFGQAFKSVIINFHRSTKILCLSIQASKHASIS